MRTILITSLLIVPLLVVPVFNQSVHTFSAAGEGYLGVGIRDVTSQDVEELGLAEERGVYVTHVREAGPAEEAGIQQGDVILQYSGLPVLSARQFQRMVGDTPSGREVEVEVFRSRRTLSLAARLGSRQPPAPPDFEAFPPFYGRIAPRPHRLDPGPGVFRFSGRPRLGIRGEALTEQLGEYFGVTGRGGVLVTEVMEGTPAEKAGVLAGDVIVSINGSRVASLSDVSGALEEAVVEVEIVRDKQVQTLSVDLRTEEGPSTRI